MVHLKTLHSICKRKVSYWASGIVDTLFPPSCRICHTSTRNLLCNDCQELLAIPDPLYRCRHCFVLLENAGMLCNRCIRSPLIGVKRAFLFDRYGAALRLRALLLCEEELDLRLFVASMLVVLYERLQWEKPDRILTLPLLKNNGYFLEIVEMFSQMIAIPVRAGFYQSWSRPFHRKLKRKGNDLMENETILLIDFSSSIKEKRQAMSELWSALPKEVTILSIF